MNTTIIHFIFFTFLAIFTGLFSLQAQEIRKEEKSVNEENILPGQSAVLQPYFIGVELVILTEPWYASGEVDVNVCPLVFEYRFWKRVTLKLRCGIYRHSGGESSGSYTMQGGNITLPYYIFSDEKLPFPNGFYAAPFYNYSYNHMTGGTHNTGAIEVGYGIPLGNFSMNISAQLGRSRITKVPLHSLRILEHNLIFVRHTMEGPHVGVFFSFGRWF